MSQWKWLCAILALCLTLIGCADATENDDPYDDDLVDTDGSGLHTVAARTIACKASADAFTVTISGDVLGGTWNAWIPAPVSLQYGSDTPYYWALPYAGNSGRQSLAWTGNQKAYVFTLPRNANRMNFAIVGSGSSLAWFKFGNANNWKFTGDCKMSGTVLVQDVYVPPPPPPPPVPGTLKLVTVVTNDDGGISATGNFNIHVVKDADGTLVVNTLGVPAPGTAHTLNPLVYRVKTLAKTGYTVTFGGDCSSTGVVTLNTNDVKTCTINANDIAAPPPGDPTMSIRCTATSAALTVTITGPVQEGVFANVASPKSIQYGNDFPSNYWNIPYPAGSGRTELPWTTNAGPYVFALPSDTNGMNFFLASNAGGVGQWFDLDPGTPWTILGDCRQSGTLVVRK